MEDTTSDTRVLLKRGSVVVPAIGAAATAFSAAVLCLFTVCLSVSPSVAQTTQRAQGNAINMDGNRNGAVTVVDIHVILDSESALLDEPAAREVIADLKTLLLRLVSNGDLAVTENGVRALARGAVQQLAAQPIERGLITTRQFAAPLKQTVNIAGTDNRVTYRRDYCGGGEGVWLMFNNKNLCLRHGEAVDFSDDGRDFELVFDGFSSGNREALFTIYPVN